MRIRDLGPGDIETWGPPRDRRDPRLREIEPPHSSIETQVAVLAGNKPCDEIGRDFEQIAEPIDFEPLDPCQQSRSEILALIAKYRDEAPAAFRNLTHLLEQAQ